MKRQAEIDELLLTLTMEDNAPGWKPPALGFSVLLEPAFLSILGFLWLPDCMRPLGA
jgi:hypothetical protein